VIEHGDGRGFILEAIARARSNIRLTIHEITDLASVEQTPAAPARSVVQALIRSLNMMPGHFGGTSEHAVIR
jgi:hypothetical protein